jgi:hypothetical protein
MGLRNTATSVERMTRFLKDPMVGPILTELVTSRDEFEVYGRKEGMDDERNVIFFD